jgi:hypothetical protein
MMPTLHERITSGTLVLPGKEIIRLSRRSVEAASLSSLNT